MRLIVKLLIGCLIALSISGCSETIFTSCITPDVKEPRYDNSHKEGILEKSKQCVSNFLIAKQYAEKLKEANEVCK